MPLLGYLTVAALIALASFVVAQVLPGAGVPLVILASLGWTGHAARRTRDCAL